MNRLRRAIARDEGFTLAELLVVVTVLGILLAIAVPLYLGFTKKASDTAGAANARSAAVTTAANDALGSAAPPPRARPPRPRARPAAPHEATRLRASLPAPTPPSSRARRGRVQRPAPARPQPRPGPPARVASRPG